MQQGDDSKAVKVGTRIAVTAEPDDDISSLEMPAEDKAAAPKEQPKQESAPALKKEATKPTPKPESSGKSKAAAGRATKQTYPLYPSVQHLLKVNGLPKEEADKIPATGPNGRLLKGDVLVYLGSIQESSTATVADRLKKLSHLDLSNIKPAAPKKAPAPEKAAAPEPIVVEDLPVELALPISLKAVLECQKRVQESIGVFLPVSTFIARAAELANDELPRSTTSKPSANELFNAVLGLDKIAGKKFSRGHFMPQVTALPPTALRPRTSATKKPDTLDFLAGKKPYTAKTSVASGAAKVVAPLNVFSVSVPKGDERRGRVFLERIKSVLEVEPGRLVV
jgi:pyruvate/2-oxoglutarate dehydrogenase complex dihydrolipoamide acyltransferase (E2) component